MRTITQKVAAGIKFLNKYGPKNWLRKIKVTQLDLASSFSCILGQIYGSYNNGCESLNEHKPSFGDDGFVGVEIRSNLGFTIDLTKTSYNDLYWNKLTEAWKVAIRAEKKKAKATKLQAA